MLQAQRSEGVYRIHVSGEAGTTPVAVCELAPKISGVPQSITTDQDGICAWRDLPAGSYQARINSVGFRPAEVAVQVAPAAVTESNVTLRLAAADITVNVTATTDAESSTRRVTSSDVQQQSSTQPGRELVDIVRQQPGWLLEANGVLHPRGSEYDTQYIVDGIPSYENRSPAFAPLFDMLDVDGLEIRTGGFPAAYGRKLGGVVEVESKDHVPTGWHGALEFGGGAFDTQQASATIGLATRLNTLQLSASGARTSRFLDPPTIDNFNNHGHAAGVDFSLAHKFDAAKRVRVAFRRGRSEFQVPNEIEQQLAGQRQWRGDDETAGQVSYQQILSPDWLFDVHASARSLGASLQSNAESTPIAPWQDRGLTEFYASGSVAGHRGRHELGLGVDFIRTRLREAFRYSLSDASAFDPGVLPEFDFAQRSSGNQSSWYVQDRISAGPLTANLGLRWDYYGLLLQQTAWSPRLAAALRLQPLGIVLRGSFDRIFSTPPLENLLLASSVEARQVTPVNLGLPVPPAHGNFFELGAAREFGRAAHLEMSAYRRDFRDYSDDDVFLNTGVSFPISFSQAQVEGIEASLRVQLATKLTAAATYSNLSGTAHFPVTGGLFLDGSAALLQSDAAFRITQDQRSTASWFVRYQVTRRVSLATNGLYGSGLPVELEDGAPHTADPRILQRVDLSRGRLRPSYSVGLSAGALLWTRNDRAASVQFAVDNVTDHLNVINFAGLLSGTALGTPRALSIKVKYAF